MLKLVLNRFQFVFSLIIVNIQILRNVSKNVSKKVSNKLPIKLTTH